MSGNISDEELRELYNEPWRDVSRLIKRLVDEIWLLKEELRVEKARTYMLEQKQREVKP